MAPHPVPADIYFSLTHAHREEIANHVRWMIAATGGPTLDGDQLNDMIRWVLEGFGRSTPYDDAFHEGYEAGREAGG